MSTPSQRLWQRQDDDATTLETSLPDRPRNPVTLAASAARIAAGTALREAAADFLDDLRFARDDTDVASRIADEPPLTDQHTDAYLAAIAEHVATGRSLPTPEWTLAPTRFLDHMWWPPTTVGLHARAIVESPAAFRRRGIFIGRTSLQRV